MVSDGKKPVLLAGFMGRIGFGDYLRGKNLFGKAAEIGTHQGDFAVMLLGSWSGFLYCVDHWKRNYHPIDPAAFGDRDRDYRIAQDRLESYFPNRYLILKQASKDAAPCIPNESLDMVYIDANHETADVAADLEIWYPKVKPEGIIAGHDIVCACEVDGGWGRMIQPAVFDFAAKTKLDLYLVPEMHGAPWSYFLEKPPPDDRPKVPPPRQLKPGEHV